MSSSLCVAPFIERTKFVTIFIGKLLKESGIASAKTDLAEVIKASADSTSRAIANLLKG